MSRRRVIPRRALLHTERPERFRSPPKSDRLGPESALRPVEAGRVVIPVSRDTRGMPPRASSTEFRTPQRELAAHRRPCGASPEVLAGRLARRAGAQPTQVHGVQSGVIGRFVRRITLRAKNVIRPPSRVRSEMSRCSKWAITPNIWNTSSPAAEEVSRRSSRLTKWTPRASMLATITRSSRKERPSRSRRVTHSRSPGRAWSMSSASPGRSERFPEATSVKIRMAQAPRGDELFTEPYMVHFLSPASA